MIIESVLDKISLYTKNHDKIILSISGGLDSIALLDLVNSNFKKSGFEIHIIHVNYKSSDNSDLAEKLCLNLSNVYNNKIKIFTKKISKNNFESKARDYRYKILSNYAIQNNIKIIFTAHHEDDQIETLYMRYINNSDWISMLGIRSTYGIIKRPFLGISKKILLEYVENKKLSWVDDLTNYDTRFTRNKVRLEILPNEILKNKDLKNDLMNISKKSYSRYEKLVKNIKVYINENFKKINKFYYISNNITQIFSKDEIKLFYQLFISMKCNYVTKNTSKHWSNLYQFICCEKPGTMFYIDTNIVIYMDRKNHFLMQDNYLKEIKNLYTNKKKKVVKFPILWFNNSIITDSIKNKYNISISKKKFKEGIYVRYWRPGDKCYIKRFNKYVKLKKLFINNKLSIVEKSIIPIFIDNNDSIISIPNIYSRTSSDEVVRIRWKQNYE